MRLARMQAGGKSVQAADAVGKAVFFQEFQRAVGHGRLIAKAFGRQPRQHIIGPHGAVRLKQDFQHPAAHRRQARA